MAKEVVVSMFLLLAVLSLPSAGLAIPSVGQLENIRTAYPKAWEFMMKQPEYQQGQVVYQSRQFNIWLNREGIKPCAIPNEPVNRCMEILERHLTKKGEKPYMGR